MLPRSALVLATSLVVLACGGSTEPTAAAPAPTPTTTTPPSAPTTEPDASVTPIVTATTDYFPPATGTWETVTAADAGFDQAKLDAVVSFVEQSATTTFMILYEGRILVEKYWGGATASTLKDIASAQKSVLSMLMGTLLANGTVALTDTVTSILGDGWSNATPAQEAPITLRQILTMTSGLDASLGYAAPPGSAWLYNTDAYHRNGLIVAKKTGMTLDAYTRATIFDPIGVGTSAWSTRGAVRDSKGMAVDSLNMNARDMARIGLLVMHGGSWQDRTLVPSAYMTLATTTSQTFNPSYGFLFWLNGQSSALLPPAKPLAGSLMPSAPADLVAALGANDQKIHATRTAKIVITRQGAAAGPPSDAATGWDEQLWQKLDAAKL